MPCSIVSHRGLVGVSTGCPRATGMSLTRYAPFRRSPPGRCRPALPLDLHVLSLPLAFILSQDQTLLCIFSISQVQSGTSNFQEINALDFFVFGTCFLVLSLSVFSMNYRCFSNGLQRYALFSSLQIFSDFFLIFFIFYRFKSRFSSKITGTLTRKPPCH